MIEFPEACTLARHLNAAVAGKTVRAVLPPTKPHKFCFFNGDPSSFDAALAGKAVLGAEAFGMFAQLCFKGDQKLCVNDGVNLRLVDSDRALEAHQLRVDFTDGTSLVFTVAMYGGIAVFSGEYENEYYQKSRQAVSPFSPGFEAYFDDLFDKSKPSLSAKAFLATLQRFPGIGNGVAQDILFRAGIHPKRKLSSMDGECRRKLLESIVSVLGEMVEQGGRDTEKNLFGEAGGYMTLMSKKALATGCPVCGGAVTKEAYLGGSVYFCESCQPLHEK